MTFPQCTWCEGTREVNVAQVETAVGLKNFGFPGDTGPEIQCPHCSGSGEEPALNPLDDPRIP